MKLNETLSDLKYVSSNIQIRGGNEIIAEGCESVIECGENRVKLKQAKRNVIIDGFDLEITCFGADGIIIKGNIHALTFEKFGE